MERADPPFSSLIRARLELGAHMAKSPTPRGDRSVKIGPYEVIKRIGAGGMGTVYLATDTDLGRKVALKVLPGDLGNRAEAIERFRQEAQHAARLRHENIVTIYGCGEHKGLHYLAMEYVEGCNLHEYIERRGKLAPEDARILMLQAAKALASAHEQNIVHRDIKPSNFLLAAEGGRPVVKLTDFGLARTVDDLDGKITRSGTTVGTVDYISPEQARNSRAADIRSDIYSLGCTLYHMLAGRPPFPDGDLTERLLKHVEAEPPDIHQFNPNVTPGLAQILKKMLAKKPEERYQTPTQLIEELTNPPKTPAISTRAALELLAEASGEKARPARPSSSMQETRRQIKEATAAALPAKLPPTGADLKLHYRKKKNERRKRPEKGDLAADEMTSPFVLEGFGPWIAVIGGLAAVALIACAILYRWGGKTESRREPEPVASSGEEKETDKKDIAKQTKDVVQTLKKDAAKRRDGEDPNASRSGLEEMKKSGELSRIDDSGSKRTEEMQKLFAKKESSSPDNELDEINAFYKKGERGGRKTTPADSKSDSGPGNKSSNDGTAGTPRNSGNRDGSAGKSNGPPPGEASNKSTPPASGPGGKQSDQQQDAKPPSGSDPKTPPTSGQPATMGQGGSSARLPDAGKPGANATPGTGVQPPKTRVVQVRRDLDGTTGSGFGSIAAAIQQAQSSPATTVIEIRDNGPFFENAITVANQSVVVRGAAGYRPLIVLTDAGGGYLFQVQNARLALDGIDLALKVSEGQPDVASGLVRVSTGTLLVEDCTFSLAGRSHGGLDAVRLDAPPGDSQTACTLRRSFCRGPDLIAINVQGPAASVLVEQCLLVGQGQPLIMVRGQTSDRPSSVRVAHSTLVGGAELCDVDATTTRELGVPTQLVFWDSLLARSAAAEGGEMLKLGKNVPLQNIQWRAVNTLYAGWRTLLSYSGGTVPAGDLAAWHSLIHQEGGDKALSLSWPAYLPPETDRIPTALFRTAGTAAAFRDSSGEGSVGCSVQDLPPVRLTWPSYTYERAASPALDTRAPDRPPEIPAANDGLYHGGRVDVSRIDLGEHLQKLQDAGQLARRVVIHLAGKGTASVTPFRLKDVQLTLYAESSGGSALLIPKPGASADALMHFENGGCELLGVQLAPPPADKVADIGAFVLTKNAGLRMIGCRIKGGSGKNRVRTLAIFGGSGESSSEQSRECIVADCVLQTGGTIVRLLGNGIRLRIQNSVLLAGEDAVVLEPGSLAGPLNVHCVLDHDTLAARGAVVRVQDILAGVPPLDALPVQTRGCVFVNPFGDLPQRAGLLAYEDHALTHGLVSWQPDGNVYDRQLGFAVASRESGRETDLSPDSCQRIWGPLADRRGTVFEGGSRDFKLDQPNWERLSLPAATRAKFKGTPPGADFEQLGIGRR